MGTLCVPQASGGRAVISDNLRTNACPVCRSGETWEFFTQYGVPVQAGYLAPTAAEARECA